MDPFSLASLGAMFGGGGGGGSPLSGLTGGGAAPGIEETNSQSINTKARGGTNKLTVRVNPQGGKKDKGEASTTWIVVLAIVAVLVLVILAIVFGGK